MANKAATKVPGRKVMVTAAMVLIARESSFDVKASLRESSPMEMLTWVSFWVMMLKSCVVVGSYCYYSG